MQRGYMSSQDVIERLRPKFNAIAGARMFLIPMSSTGVRAGGRQGNGSLQYTVQADTLDELNQWLPKITDALQNVPQLEDVNSDQQDKGLDVALKIDRATASRLGLNAAQVDNALYDAFGQRQVSTIYKDKNQYHVVMEVAPAFWQSPETLRDIYISTAGNVTGTQQFGGGGRRVHRLCCEHCCLRRLQHQQCADWRRLGPCQRRADHRNGRSGGGAQPAAQFHHQHRTGQRIDRSLGLHVAGDHGAVVGLCQLRARHDAAIGEPSGGVRRHHIFSFNLPQGVTEDQALTAPSTAPWRGSMCRSRCMAKRPVPCSWRGRRCRICRCYFGALS